MDFSFHSKPAGVPTHQVERSSDPRHWGFCEYLGQHQRMFVVHRLDRDTSGAIVFAHTSAAAAELSALFAERRVHKEYLLVTDRKAVSGPGVRVEGDDWKVESHIEKRGSRFVSHLDSPVNSETHFTWLKNWRNFSLWRAVPITGKPHQIRLHAQMLGMPIVGDAAHGGTHFPRLLLHSERLSFGDQNFVSPPPRVMIQLELLAQPQLVRWITAIEKREALFAGAQTSECRRLIHTDGGELRADRLGPIVMFYWFGPTSPEGEVLEQVRMLASVCGIRSWYLRWMQNRGSGVQQLPLWKSDPDLPETWVALENGLRFEMRATSLSPGLFLDQRANRAWLHAVAKDKSVLNLFCFTGGFSVAAAKGGASQVVSVDLSANFLRWLKVNFAHNGVDPNLHEFWTIDARPFLEGAAKKKRQFDLIICDPPSFARGSGGIFRIEKDLSQLIAHMHQVLAPGGEILLCTNYEKWTSAQFAKVVAASAHTHGLTTAPCPPAEWDFEGPGQDPILKTVRLISPSCPTLNVGSMR